MDNILVVYKKNFEEVHDQALESIRNELDTIVSERGISVDYSARETVRRADFIQSDLVVVFASIAALLA